MRLVSQVLTWVMVVVPVLGWIPPLLVPKDVPEPLHSTQDNFDLEYRGKRDTVNITAEEEGSGFNMPVFIDPAACLSEPDSGPCFGMKVRFFYNSSSMSCQEFQYGGCMGNQNNFLAERECLQRCRTEAACRLPMVVEACVGQPPVWAFDAQAGGCVAYKTGFCQRNGNKFYSKAECDEYCGVVTDEAEFLKTN